MPTVAPQYAFPLGSAVDATGHNGNMYSSTPEHGIMSVVNGHLELPEEGGAVTTDNFELALKREHFQMDEHLFVDRYTWEAPVTIYDDTAGGTASEDEAAPSMVGLRFRVPAYCETLRIDYSFFLSAARAVTVERDNNDGQTPLLWNNQTGILEAHIGVFLNGTEYEAMRIYLPATQMHGEALNVLPANTGDRNHVTSYEHLTAQQYSDGLILHNVAPGTKTLQFRVRLENPAGAFTKVVGIRLGLVEKKEAFTFRLHQRSTFGCGSVTVVGKGLSNTAY